MMLVSCLLVVGILVVANAMEFKKEDMAMYAEMHKNCWKEDTKAHFEECLPEEVKKMTEDERKAAAEKATDKQLKEAIQVVMTCVAKNHKMLDENNEVNNEEHCNYINKHAIEGKAKPLVDASKSCENKDCKEFEKCFVPKYMEICKS